MKLRTLNTLVAYIEAVNRAIHTVADIGPGADLSPLSEATESLRDALEVENVAPESGRVVDR